MDQTAVTSGFLTEEGFDRLFLLKKLSTIMLIGALVGLILLFSNKAMAESGNPSQWPDIETTKPIKKLFTTITHHHYWEKLYKPSPTIQPLEKEPEFYQSPEEVLISQISARKALDFDWWLNTWDPSSRSKILERAKSMGRTEKFWLHQWKMMYVPSQVRLVRWILKGQYVIVTYRLFLPESDPSSTDIREIPMAFALFEGKWLATLDMEANPIFLFSGEEETQIGKIYIERTIRK